MESALIAEEMEPAIMTEATFRADRFAKLMQKRNLTDGKLAYASGVSRTMIYYMRKGERSKVSAETIAALAGPLGTSTQYLMGQTDDPSPMQKTMSGMIADIVDIADKLPLSRQRELRELGRSLMEIERSTDIEMIYSELMERITRLAELDGGEDALDRLLTHLSSVADRPSSLPGAAMPGDSRRRMKGGSKPIEKPTQSDN